MPEISVRPRTDAEFAALRPRMVREYAADRVRAGDWDPADAERLAAESHDQLLGAGVRTPGMLLLVAEAPGGDPVGHLWLALERAPGTAGAWIYDIEIAPERRGQGFGRALLHAAEVEAARHGAASIGLNVFGTNDVARRLYQSAGYRVATMQMNKELAGVAETLEPPASL